MNYRCRFVQPIQSEWHEVEAETPEDAAQDFHFERDHWCQGLRFRSNDGGPQYRFALVEVDGHGELVSRTIYEGIYRRGGVRPQWSSDKSRLQHIAGRLGWSRPAEELVTDWPGQEPAP